MSEHEHPERPEQPEAVRLRLALERRRERAVRDRAAWQPPAAPLHTMRRRRGRQ